MLHRLHPEMPEACFDSVLAKLRAMRAAGRWHGFARP